MNSCLQKRVCPNWIKSNKQEPWNIDIEADCFTRIYASFVSHEESETWPISQVIRESSDSWEIQAEKAFFAQEKRIHEVWLLLKIDFASTVSHWYCEEDLIYLCL